MILSLCGKDLEIKAEPYNRQATSQMSAWQEGRWISVKTSETIDGLRVHTDGKVIDARPVDPSNAVGRWVLIDDVIFTAKEISENRALPGAFTKTSQVQILKGSVINIGLCAPLFGRSGGSWQAEFVLVLQ